MATRISKQPAAKARAPREDGAQTRAKLLEAAGIVFAAKGFDKATAKEIVRKAGVNAAAVNYHFGGVDGLYQEVLVVAHDRIVSLEDLHSIVGATGTPEARLRHLMRLLAGVIEGPVSQSWAIRLLIREIMAPSPHLDALRRKALEPKKSVVFSLVADLLRRPVDDPDVARCFLSIVAPCFMLLLVERRLMSKLVPVMADGGADAVADHLSRFALGGLKAVARQAR